MKLFAVIALGTACLAAQTGPVTAIANVGARSSASLDGKWKAIVDPYEFGYYDFRLQPSKEGYFLDAKPKNPSERIEYNFDTSTSLEVPGDWNSQRDNLFFYEGTVWYRRLFDYTAKPGQRTFLHFGAANYEAIVYLNGEKLGAHTGGFTPFAFEITGKTKEKGNSVVVKVDNKRHREGVPTVNTDWWNYGGLTRSVSLVEVPGTFVQDYFVQLKKGSSQEIAGWVKLDGSGRAGQKVTVRIPEANVSATVTTDATGYAAIDIPAKLTLWSPENPKLYDVAITAESDSVHDQIGFRTIETKGTDILLNGKSVFLRGVSIHEEAPFRGGRAFSKEDARTLLGWAKELGCNFVRLAHYPHNENMVREADRMGLLVWSETPVYWTIEWENPETCANASHQLAESMARDKNRASIILWSVANETPVGDARNAFLRKLAAQAHSADPTRLVTAAMLHHGDSAPAGHIDTIDDPLGSDLDVLGCNEYLGWYDGLPDKADSTEWRSSYNKPLIMSEFGADALYGLHGDPMTRWTEEYQENVFHHQIRMLDKISFLRGTTPWILMDFRSPRRTLPEIQDYFNRKGLVSLRGEKKKAFFVMQEFYQKKAQLH
jgi:beta-glucuronidase